MARGLLISFEGIDKAGKETQIALLSAFLDAHGVAHTVGREPGGTAYGEAARRLVQDPRFIERLNTGYADVPGVQPLDVHGELNAQAELFGYLLARSLFAEQRVLPVLQRGALFIADRCADSALAFQGYGNALGDPETLAFIRAANAFALQRIPIARTYYLDITVEESLRRKGTWEFGAERDRIELRDSSFHERVRQGYLAIAQHEPTRVLVVDGMRPEEEVARTIRADLLVLLDRHGLLSAPLSSFTQGR